jgi:hypothetical protein
VCVFVFKTKFDTNFLKIAKKSNCLVQRITDNFKTQIVKKTLNPDFRGKHNQWRLTGLHEDKVMLVLIKHCFR